MASTPLVSILLPVYNGESFVAGAIESALSQSLSDLELIIVDDFSVDSSREIVERYQRRDERIKFFKNENNIGLFENYNRALQSATGQYIKPFAQDDLLHENALQKMVAVLEQRPHVALVSSARRWADRLDNEIKVVKPFPRTMELNAREVMLYNLLPLTNWVGEPSTVLFRREHAGTGFDTSIYHLGDLDLWFRVLSHGRYCYLDEVLATFRRHPESATSSNLKGLLFALDFLRLGRKYSQLLSDFGETPDRFRLRAVEIFARHLDYLVENEGVTVEEAQERCLSASGLARSGASAEKRTRLVLDFVELSFSALRYVTFQNRKLHDLECRAAAETAYLSTKIDHLENSTSWKLTAPLRNLVRAIKT